MTSTSGLWRNRFESTWIAATVPGVFAATLIVPVQLLVWLLAAMSPVETLLRDARLTAAVVLGRAILTTEPRWQWDVLLVAMLIHYSLSVAYAALAFPILSRMSPVAALAVGAIYGLLIYGVNLHALAPVFPWFSVTRGWDTVFVHIAFGTALAGACSALRSTGRVARHDPPISRQDGTASKLDP